MGQVIVTILVLWAALAVGTGIWVWVQQRWSRYQHGADMCACGLYPLHDIHAQHTTVAVHERERCFPRREALR